MRFVAAVGILIAVGAFVGLIVATIVNENCDSFAEQLNGCTRIVPSGGAAIGAGIGFLLGMGIGIALEIRVASRAARDLRRAARELRRRPGSSG